jgi:multimeric flavodoxin WrbA
LHVEEVSMKFVAISGSRNPKGQTAQAIEALVQGLKSQGAEGEVHYLPALKIERCRQCDDNGWGICRSEGHCTIEDDMAMLVAQIKAADLAIFATPVYFGDLSESLRAFTDRLRRTCMNASGAAGIKDKPALALCVAGGGGGGGPNCAVSMDRVLRTCGFDLLDVLPLRRQTLAAKLPVIEATGQWLAKR